MAQLMTQATNPFEQELAKQDRARSVFKISIITAAAMVPFTLYNLYVALLDPIWQQFSDVGLTILVGLAGLLSAWLSRRGRSGLGVLLLIGTLWLTLLLASLTVAGLGLVLALAAVLATAGLAGVGLPPKQAGRVIVGGVVIGILILGIDFYFPLERPAVGRPILTQGIIIAILAIYGLFVARQFRNYSVRTKLIIAFLTVTVMAVGATAFFNTRSTTAALEEQVGSNLHSLADSVAVSVGSELLRQVVLLQTLAAGRPLQASLSTANMFRLAGELREIQAEMVSRDMLWTTLPDSDPVVQAVISGAFAKQFRNIQAKFPDHVEIFVTDQYGGLVAATNRPSDFYQADEGWWQAAFNNGQGAIYIDQPEFDASSNTVAVRMAVPIIDDDTGKLVGVLRTTYRLQALADLLSTVQTGYAALYAPGGKFNATEEVGFNPADPETLVHLETLAERSYGQFPYEGVASLVSQAPVRAITGEAVIDQLDWNVVVHQTQAEALAPVEAQTQSSLFLALVILGLASAVAVGMAQLLAGPISRLTRVASQVAEGDLAARAEVESRDEIGQLATVFNTMTGQLRQTIGTLEEQVTGRTRQLATVVQVNQRLAGILELSDLLRQVVVLTKETFDYYHAHIYLLEGETLLLAEGYGAAGAEMKRQGHSITLAAPRSLVARSAREGQVITVANVREDPNWLPNSLLPDTHSEMAVPVMLGKEVVGVLDVQSDRVGGLTEEDETALQALSNQVAIAVRNARLFAQTQVALDEAQRLQRQYTGQAWQKFVATQPTTDYEFRQSSLPPLQTVPTPEATAAIEQEGTVTLITNGKPASPQKTDGPAEKQVHIDQPASRSRNALATPLKLRDEIIGVLGIHDEDPERRWSQEELALIEAVSEQMSLALENARLFDETGRRASRERIIAEVTRRVWASGELEQVMQTAVEQLGAILDASKVVVRLGTADRLPVASRVDDSSEA